MRRVRSLVVCLVLSFALVVVSVGLAFAAGSSRPTTRTSRTNSKIHRSSPSRRRTHRLVRSKGSHHASRRPRHGRHVRPSGKRGRVALATSPNSLMASPLAVPGVQPLIGDEGEVNERKHYWRPPNP